MLRGFTAARGKGACEEPCPAFPRVRAVPGARLGAAAAWGSARTPAAPRGPLPPCLPFPEVREPLQQALTPTLCATAWGEVAVLEMPLLSGAV